MSLARIRLREPARLRGCLGFGGAAQGLAGNPGRQRLEAQGLALVAPELLVEEDRVEPVDAVGEPHAAIRLPEELRVAQPGGQDALGVAADELGPLDFHVRDREKGRLQPAVFVHHGEVVLVVNHRGRQDFLGQREELGREHPGDHRRPLDQIRHLVEQRLARGGPVHPPAQASGVDVELADDALAAILALEDHEVLEEPRLVVVERLDLHGAPRAAARGQEAVAVGHGGRPHLLDERRLRQLGAADLEGHDAAAVQEQQPADRAPEGEIAPAVVQVGVPAHVPRERQSAEQARHHGGERVHGGPPPLSPAVGEIPAARRVGLLEIGDLHAVLPREAQRGGGRLPVGAARGRDGRTGHELLEIGLPLGHPAHAHRQPPRRRPRIDRPVDLEARGLQLGGRHRRQLRGQAGQPAGGDLLDADLDEQFSVHSVPAEPAACCLLPTACCLLHCPPASARPHTLSRSRPRAAGPAARRPCARSRRCCRCCREC